jgi:hypothetical protein
MGKLFSVDSLFKIAKVALNVGLLFPQLLLCINFYPKGVGLLFGRFFNKVIWSPWLGYILGDFFTNSSGHLDPIPTEHGAADFLVVGVHKESIDYLGS